MRRLVALLLATFSPIGLATAHADSEGYYCIGQGYFAYQFGMDAQRNPPRVSVLRTSTSGDTSKPMELTLPPFQVHAMRCGDGWIDVAAFTQVYRITLDANDNPVRYETRPLAGGSQGLSEFLSTPNLALLSRAARTLTPERVVLGETARGTSYVLITTASLLPPPERCRTSITTRIVEVDRVGREFGARPIFQGQGTRECGD